MKFFKKVENYTNNFYLKDGESTSIKILSEEPHEFSQHYWSYGKKFYICGGAGCPLCEFVAKNEIKVGKPKVQFAFEVLDLSDDKVKTMTVAADDLKAIFDIVGDKVENLVDATLGVIKDGYNYRFRLEDTTEFDTNSINYKAANLSKVFTPISVEQVKEAKDFYKFYTSMIAEEEEQEENTPQVPAQEPQEQSGRVVDGYIPF